MSRVLFILALILAVPSARAADRYGRPSLIDEPLLNVHAERFASRHDSAYAAAYWYAEALKQTREMGRARDALDAIGRAARLSPRSKAYRRLDALLLWKSGKFQQGAEFFATASALARFEPHFPGLWAKVGYRYLADRDTAAAEPALRRAIRDDPHDEVSTLRLAELLGKTDRVDEALGLLRRLRKVAGELTPGIVSTETALLKSRDRRPQLLALAAEIQMRRPCEAATHQRRADIFEYLGMIDATLAELDSAQALPASVGRLEYLAARKARLLQREGRYNEAAMAFGRADSLLRAQGRGAADAGYLECQAWNLNQAGQSLDSSLAVVSAVLDRNSRSAWGWEFKADLLSRAQRWEEALAAADERLRLEPDSVAPAIYAVKLRILNDWRDQQMFLGTPAALIVHPSFSDLAAGFDNWAAALAQCGADSAAEHAISHAITLDSTRGDYFYRRAGIRAPQPGREAAALEDLRRAIVLAPRFAGVAAFDDRFQTLRALPEFPGALAKSKTR